jgi:hypothetical protein
VCSSYTNNNSVYEVKELCFFVRNGPQLKSNSSCLKVEVGRQVKGYKERKVLYSSVLTTGQKYQGLSGLQH